MGLRRTRWMELAGVNPTPRARQDLMRFAAVAGCGWLIDAICLLAFSRVIAPGLANVASSLIAASFVYLVSHRYVHSGQPSMVGLRLGAYAVYTVGLILVASLAMTRILPVLKLYGSPVVVIICAKIIITPPQFLCNFVTSRFLAHLRAGAA
jgi:putative flippase GtrA